MGRTDGRLRRLRKAGADVEAAAEALQTAWQRFERALAGAPGLIPADAEQSLELLEDVEVFAGAPTTASRRRAASIRLRAAPRRIR